MTSKLIYECVISIIQIHELETSQARPVPLELLHQFFLFFSQSPKGRLAEKTWLADEMSGRIWRPLISTPESDHKSPC